MTVEHPNTGKARPSGRHEVDTSGYSSRESRSFGVVEVARYRYLPGELEVPPPEGHVVSLHLGGPIGLVQRRGGREHEGLDVRGDVKIVPAGIPSYWRLDEACDGLNVVLDKDFVERVAAEVGLDRVEIIDRFNHRDQQVERIGLSLLSEAGGEGLVGGELYAESLANALAVHLLRHHSSAGRRSALMVEREHGRRGLSGAALRRATDYVNDNLAGIPSLADIARAAGVSPYHFARLFKESTGLSPHQYVIHQRVEKAKGMLSRGRPVGEVALSVGFSHQGHLSRHFKRLTGVTPKAFDR